MNRFVSLLLVALCLAAVSLAQPAQAQNAPGQWLRGLPYYFNSNTQSGGNVATSPVGHINITSTPVPGYPGYNAGGSYSGSVGINYVWAGGSLTSAMRLTTPLSCEVTGAGYSYSSGSSLAGGLYGSFSYGTTGWDTKASSAPFIRYYNSGTTPPPVNLSASLGGNVYGYYDQINPGASTTVTADVTFGNLVVTQ